MKKLLLATFLMIGATAGAFAQEEEQTLPEKNQGRIDVLESKVLKIENLKISGYIQGQWQWAESPGIPAFADGGSFNATTNNRFMVRRGRIKFTYSIGIFQAVFQPDFTEKGVSIKDAYLAITSKDKVIGGQIGVFDRPFGYEISYSSSLRESPERSRVFLSLFPGERGTSAMLTLRGKTGTALQNFALNAGLFNGNGIGAETDSQKDFIGRLAWLKKMESAQVGVAVSYYGGGVINPTNKNFVYQKGTGFVETAIRQSEASKREYVGLAAQFLQQWGAGTTNIRAEYLMGNQPGTIKTNADPGGSSLGAGTEPLYLRQFVGYYAILVQDIGQSKHSIVLKYDYYDPNTQISGNEIGKLAGTGPADIAYSTLGVGYLFRWNANIRLMAYYDMINNETSTNLSGFGERIKQNVFTARVQMKF